MTVMAKYKQPSLEEFRKVLQETGGNLTNTAARLGVTRVTLWKWQKADEEFAQAVQESRKRLLDQCITTAQLIAMGIPMKDDEGKIVGWQERPDSQMLRYFISTLGRDEGFGENVDITTNGKDIIPQIQIEVIDRREDVAKDDEQGTDD